MAKGDESGMLSEESGCEDWPEKLWYLRGLPGLLREHVDRLALSM